MVNSYSFENKYKVLDVIRNNTFTSYASSGRSR